jgi:hypothetical protein
MLASTGLRKERAEAVVDDAGRLVRRNHAIGLNPVLQAVQLPAGVAHLAAGLANVNRNALPHFLSLRRLGLVGNKLEESTAQSSN